MSASKPAGPEPEGHTLQPPQYGRPAAALIARADRGYARFLAAPGPDDSTGGHDSTTLTA
ncbi:hypothetical protein [Streptomyces sp. NPDC051546]|uniref:hypothetical protein n=1 Tax=Streptomyces sp. NPDC051546 TaxID=3365655 RepID=UPI00379784DF